MIFITGDTHGGIDIKKLCSKSFPQGKNLTKNDYVIICGDFGFIWNCNVDATEQYWMKWFQEKPWTTLFVDGNHERFDRLNSYKVEKWHGGNIHRINDSVIHLMRGQVFEIEGKTFFTFGGAQSYDKELRVEGFSWWPEELPNYAETNEGLINLEKYNNKVDYVITHTCPHTFSYQMIHEIDKDPTANILDNFMKEIEYKAWFFGHWHVDKEFDNTHVCVYQCIYQMDE